MTYQGPARAPDRDGAFFPSSSHHAANRARAMRPTALAAWPALVFPWRLSSLLSTGRGGEGLQLPLGRPVNNVYQGLGASSKAQHDRLGAVACENKVCSQIGVDLLNAGGNAADALVGTVFCIGVVDSHHSGPGGGGFALGRSANGAYESIDFRESAPAAAHQDMFEHNVLGSIFGGLSRLAASSPRSAEELQADGAW